MRIMAGILKYVSMLIVVLLIASGANARAEDAAGQNRAAQVGSSWHSPSLIDNIVTGANDAITTRTALEANERWGITPDQRAEQVIEGVYALRGWGIASTFAIEAPEGWIILDTGDSIRAAKEMRATLEQTLDKKIRVSAILLTHWHYADGNEVWVDGGPKSGVMNISTATAVPRPASASRAVCYSRGRSHSLASFIP